MGRAGCFFFAGEVLGKGLEMSLDAFSLVDHVDLVELVAVDEGGAEHVDYVNGL